MHLFHLILFPAPVSKPRLSPPTSQVAVLGKLFTVNCYSSNGTLPITYTLYRGGIYVNKTEVKVNEPAKFLVKATNAHVPEDYSCEAKNGHSVPQRSTRVNITVIGKCLVLFKKRHFVFVLEC